MAQPRQNRTLLSVALFGPSAHSGDQRAARPLSEFGVIAAIGTAKVAALIEIVRDEADARLPKAAHFALAEIANQIEALTRQIEKLEREIVTEAKRDEDMRRLVDTRRRGDHRGFHQGACSRSRRLQVRPLLWRLAGTDAEAAFERRQGAAGRDIENGQSNAPLPARPRRDLCPAARAGQRQRASMADRPFGPTSIQVVAVALANKMARIIWALLTKGGTYRIGPVSGAASV